MTTIISGGAAVAAGERPFPSTSTYLSRTGAGLIPLLSPSGEMRAVTYEGMVRSQPWVYAAVRALVKAVIMTPLKTYDGEEATERKQVRAHALPRLISRPYPRARRSHMMMRVAWDFYVHGQTLSLKRAKTPGATPYELWPIPWRFVQKVEDDLGILGFNVYLGGQSFPLPLDDVVYTPNLIGISPLEPLRRTLALEDASIDWQGASIASGVTPRAVFQTKEAPRKSEDQRKLRDELDKLYKGQDRAGNYALLGGEWDVKEMGVSAVDLALIEQRKLSREEVAGAFGITPPLIGILDRATFNNVTELVRQFYILTVAPDLTIMADSTQAQLIDPYPEWDGLYVEFDTDVVLKPTPLDRARMHLLMQQSETTSSNERRRIENLPPIGDPSDPDNPSNQPSRPANLIPAGELLGEPVPAPANLTAQTGGLRDQLVLEAMRTGSQIPTPSSEED